MTAQKQSTIAWRPQPGPQSLAIQCPALEMMYGGAVGGGKSDFLLGDFGRDIDIGKAWQGVYFRRYTPDMDRIIQRSQEIFAPIYGIGCYSASKYQWNFPSGACLRFRAMEKDTDTLKHQGQDYSWICFDELTQWATPYCYTYMFATRLRSSQLPPGKTVRMRAASNPGGPGHQWVADRFVDRMPAGEGLQVRLKNSSYWRVFIPSKLEDNQILMKNDPGYGDRIYEMSDPVLAKALREGRWDKIEGAAISEFDKDVHVIDPAPIPSDKPIWRSMDWGYKTPYANLWLFADNEGDIIVANEIYGWSGKPDVGTEEAPADVKVKIQNYEASHGIYVPMGLLDNQCWEQRGLEGIIAEELGGAAMGWKPWPKGPNSRVQQKQFLHQMLRVVNGKSRLKIMRNCRHLIRTLPIMPTDKHNPEDVDTRSEDHAYDALRGALTHRMPTREELRRQAVRKRISDLEYTSPSNLYGGAF